MDRWFDRRFEFGRPVSDTASLLGRLAATPGRIEAQLAARPAALLGLRPAGRWSVQEHAGHLLDLEALWQSRLDDFDRGAETLHPADLGNRQTHEARHNERVPADLLAEFRAARAAVVARVAAMSRDELGRVARHPRLDQPMTVVDLCFFVAEHDDHHLAAMAAIERSYGSWPLCALDLVNAVDGAVPRLLAMDEEATSRHSRPGAWSAREILGHLVDSASNNHQRFVRAQFQQDLVFAGYVQDDWVAVQRYQDAPWTDLVTLWASFNRHLARVMASTPAHVRTLPRERHNLDQLAYRAVPATKPATLEYFMGDYVAHLRHHLAQILGSSASQAR
jgi:uncharacterized damage-inducible protein DinB